MLDFDDCNSSSPAVLVEVRPRGFVVLKPVTLVPIALGVFVVLAAGVVVLLAFGVFVVITALPRVVVDACELVELMRCVVVTPAAKTLPIVVVRVLIVPPGVLATTVPGDAVVAAIRETKRVVDVQ